MKQRGILISAAFVKAGKNKQGGDRDAALAVNVVYGNDLADGPEFVWLSPAENHQHLLGVKKYSPVEVEGRLSNGRFFVEEVRQVPA